MSAKKEIWIGMVEVRRFEDSKLLQGSSGAFVNVLTWAESQDEFQRKARTLMDHLHLDIAEIEGAEPLKNRGSLDSLEEDIAEIAAEMQFTPDAIRYSSFHTWNEPIQ
jgi:hypothetical protein